jgi:hypothetical protein
MSDARQPRRALTRRILEEDGKASPSERRGAFNISGFAEPRSTLADKVARHAYRVSDENFAAARTSGLSEDKIFEIVVSAAVGAASRQQDTALAALEPEPERSEHAASNPRQRPGFRYQAPLRAHSNCLTPAGARRYQPGQVPG